MSEPDAALFDIAAGRPASAGEGLVASAIEHRLGGLLLSASESGSIELGRADTTALVASDEATIAHHRRLWEALTSVVGVLAGVDIEPVALKGVTSEARWYRRIGERPCADVDLVLQPADIDRVDEILALLAPDYPTVAEATVLARARRLQHVHFLWHGVVIDLHFDPLKLGIWTRNADLVWNSTQTVTAPDGQVVRVLSPEIALVSALTHLNKDRFAYLGAYGEIARIAADHSLDWDVVNHFVEAEGLAVPVWCSLREVDDRLGLELDVPATEGWRAWLWQRLWPPESRLEGDDGRASHRQRQAMIPLLADDRWRETFREWSRRLLPPRALLDVHDGETCPHSYLRRITLDRLG